MPKTDPAVAAALASLIERWRQCIQDAIRFSGQVWASIELDERGSIQLARATGVAAPKLQPLIPIRLHRPDLAAARLRGNRAHRSHRTIRNPARATSRYLGASTSPRWPPKGGDVFDIAPRQQ
jgi:hypothetical protein